MPASTRALLVALAVVACREPPAADSVPPSTKGSMVFSPAPGADPRGPDPAPSARPPEHAAIPPIDGPLCDGVDLDVVAACLTHAMAIVGEDATPAGALLDRAAATGKLAPACAALPRDRSSALTSAGGHPLRVDVDTSPWDHFDDGSARRILEVRVSCVCCVETASASIEHQVGGGP